MLINTDNAFIWLQESKIILRFYPVDLIANLPLDRVASFWMLCDFRVGRHVGLADHSPRFHVRASSPNIISPEIELTLLIHNPCCYALLNTFLGKTGSL